MGFQARALLLEGDRLLQRGLAGLEFGDNGLETLEGVLEAERGLDTALGHPEHCGLPKGADMIAQRIGRQGDRERRNFKVCRGAERV